MLGAHRGWEVRAAVVGMVAWWHAWGGGVEHRGLGVMVAGGRWVGRQCVGWGIGGVAGLPGHGWWEKEDGVAVAGQWQLRMECLGLGWIPIGQGRGGAWCEDVCMYVLRLQRPPLAVLTHPIAPW